MVIKSASKKRIRNLLASVIVHSKSNNINASSSSTRPCHKCSSRRPQLQTMWPESKTNSHLSTPWWTKCDSLSLWSSTSSSSWARLRIPNRRHLRTYILSCNCATRNQTQFLQRAPDQCRVDRLETRRTQRLELHPLASIINKVFDHSLKREEECLQKARKNQ